MHILLLHNCKQGYITSIINCSIRYLFPGYIQSQDFEYVQDPQRYVVCFGEVRNAKIKAVHIYPIHHSAIIELLLWKINILNRKNM